MNKPRFKIDCTGTGSRPYELSRFRSSGRFWPTEYWEFLGYFGTREAARARYEEIKDLPEYLE